MPIDFPVMKGSIGAKTCVGQKERCQNCKLFKSGKCGGCPVAGGTGACRMSSCEGGCGTCGGHVIDVPAVCIKSPTTDLMLAKFEKDSYAIKPGRVLKPKSKAVVTLIGGRSSAFHKDPSAAYPDEVETYAVALRHVWSASRGFYSSDLKDYMALPKSKKLILQTSVFDDVLERAAQKEVHLELAERTDIDAFEPLGFSVYSDDSMLNQYVQWSRILKGMEEGGGDFITFNTPRGLHLTKDLLQYTKAVPQVMVNSQLTGDAKAQAKALRDYVFLNATLPKSVSVWMVGPSNITTVRTLQRAWKGRDVYFLSTAPWIIAHKGFAFTESGKSRAARQRPKDELVLEAQRNFVKLVDSV